MSDWECVYECCSEIYEVEYVVVVVVVVVCPFWWLNIFEHNEEEDDDELNVNVAVRDDLIIRISSAIVRSSPSIVGHGSNVNILE